MRYHKSGLSSSARELMVDFRQELNISIRCRRLIARLNEGDVQIGQSPIKIIILVIGGTTYHLVVSPIYSPEIMASSSYFPL